MMKLPKLVRTRRINKPTQNTRYAVFNERDEQIRTFHNGHLAQGYREGWRDCLKEIAWLNREHFASRSDEDSPRA